MAILESSEGSIEVRVHKDPLVEDTDYYVEHVKLSERELKGAATTDRYLPCLENETYGFEIRLKKGFNFGDYTVVRARFQMATHKRTIKAIDHPRPLNHEGGIEEDIVFHIRTASAKVDGQTIRDAHFAFKGLAVENAANISKETAEAVDIDPSICASLKITVLLCGWTQRALTEAEIDAKEIAREKRNKNHRPNKAEKRGRPKKEEDEEHTDMASEGKIREDVYKKEGLGFTMGFVGGKAIKKRAQIARNRKVEPIRNYVQTRSESAPVVFTFHVRTAEFLSSNPLYATYPPLLEFYHWESLSVPEQKVALKSLQEYHQLYTHADREKRSGQILPRNFQFKDFQLDDPREWRPWDKQSQAERRPAFETLQKFKRAAERAKVLEAVGQAGSSEFIDLEQFSAKVKHSGVELTDYSRHSTTTSHVRKVALSPLISQHKKEIKDELVKCAPMARSETMDKAPVKTPISAMAEAQFQRSIEDVTPISSVMNNELEQNSRQECNANPQPIEIASMKNEDKDEHDLPQKKKIKLDKTSKEFPAALSNVTAFIDIDSDEEQRVKLEESVRDIDQEIQEAEHLAALRKRKAVMKVELDAVKSRSRRSKTSLSSLTLSVASDRDEL